MLTIFYHSNNLQRVCQCASLALLLCLATSPLAHCLEPNSFEISLPTKLSGRIAYTANTGSDEKIMVLDIDSKRVRPLVDSDGSDFYPSWSPNGELVAFTSTRNGNREIYTCDWHGDHTKRLTKNNLRDGDPSWSADGKNVIYYSQSSSGTANIFSISLEDNKRRQITTFSSGRNITPRWSPDNRYLAYTTNRFWPGWDVCLLNLATREENCLLSGRDSFCRPAWSSDSNALAYSVGAGSQVDLSMVNLNSSRHTSLTKFDGKEYDAVWSPDNKYIAFTNQPNEKRSYTIQLVDVSNKKSITILKSPYPIRYLSWSATTTMSLEAKRLKDSTL